MGPHAEVVLGVRATRAHREAARAALGEEGWELQAFITACLLAVADNPAETLRLLAPYRPPDKPKGRPRKAAREVFEAAEPEPKGRAAKAMRAGRPRKAARPPAE